MASWSRTKRSTKLSYTPMAELYSPIIIAVSPPLVKG